MSTSFKVCILLTFISFSCFGQNDPFGTARLLESQGKFEEAYSRYKAIGDQLHSTGDLKGYVTAHLRMVDCQLQNGDPFHAKNLSENTLSFVMKELSKNPDMAAQCKTLLGLSFLNLGRNDEAIESLLEAEQLFDQTDAPEKARCFDALGLAYWNNENQSLAAQYHEQALAMRRKLFGVGSLEMGHSFNNLGLVYLKDDPLQALIYFNRAKAIYEKKLGNADRRTLRVVTNMAFAQVQQQNYEEAFALLNEVKLIYDTQYPDEHPNKAFILSSIGRVHLDKGETDQALVSQNKALQMYISLFGEKHPEVANTYYLIGEIYKAKADFKLAVSFYQRSIYANLSNQSPEDDYSLPELTNYFNPDILLTSLQAKAIALEALHFEKTLNVRDVVGAIDTYVKCDELITIIRRNRLNEADKLRLGQIAKDVYESGIQLSLILSEQSFNRKKHLERAFDFCERSKSAVLLEAITESKAKEFAGIPPSLISLEDSLKDEISYLEQQLASSDADAESNLKELLFTYQNEYRAFIADLEENFPDYYALKYSQSTASLSEIQEKLNENTALLSYFVGKNAVYVFTLTKKGIKAERKQKNERFDKLSHGLRNAIKYKIEASFVSTAKELYTQLIPKLPSGTQELVILPDGSLGTIPFEVLLDPSGDLSNYLIKDYHISYDYSATLFAQRKVQEIPRDKNILLLAPVSFDENEVRMAALPGTENEIDEIRLLFMGGEGKAEIKKGSQASEANFKSEPLDNYRYLHLATHGLVNESEPALSRIFLQPSGEEDGSLYTGEIYNLNINADLVTLSACETGLGKVAKGEGIVGLSRALQYAGANNIIVSLWQVADASTAQMMIEFYKYNLHNDHHGYNSALRAAKLKMIQSDTYSQPYYWAPFILVGM
ncbi:MAG: CHAT domain-containing protein [Ekhidna sp.]